MPKNVLTIYDGIDPDDPTPLPLIVARRCNFPLQYHVIDGQYWFSVLDWIKGITKSDAGKATKIWWKLQSQTTPSSRSLPYIATDGKTYQRDFTDDNGLYLIAAYARATKDRTTLRAIKDFLAAAGVFVDELRTNPETAINLAVGTMEKYTRMGKSPAWIHARSEGILSRKAFTDALKSAILDILQNEHAVYWRSTETLYNGLWERTSAQLRKELNLKPKEDIRDHFGQYALIYTGLAERLVADKLMQAETVPMDVALQIIWQIARMIYQQARQTSELLGYDLVTERPLLQAREE